MKLTLYFEISTDLDETNHMPLQLFFKLISVRNRIRMEMVILQAGFCHVYVMTKIIICVLIKVTFQKNS